MITSWVEARHRAYVAGRSLRPTTRTVALADADGLTLTGPLLARTDLPAFATSSMDGYAVRGPGPWQVVGRALAGGVPAPLTAAAHAMEIATGAMLPAGADGVIRTEETSIEGDLVSGRLRENREYRLVGEEAHAGEELLPAGTAVTPAVIGFAAACGYDQLTVAAPPAVAIRVFGDELRTSGLPGDGQVRDALGPALPSWVRRIGGAVASIDGPVADTLDAHISALHSALQDADIVLTTGGTMHGPVDHLHPALAAIGAKYLVNTVAVRPGFPMLVAELTADDGRPQFVVGLPGNPQSAIIALLTLVQPLLAGARGAAEPALGAVVLGGPIPGRGDDTHLALVRTENGRAWPVSHVGSAMLRGLAHAAGFAVIEPGTKGGAGETVSLLPLPVQPGELA